MEELSWLHWNLFMHLSAGENSSTLTGTALVHSHIQFQPCFRRHSIKVKSLFYVASIPQVLCPKLAIDRQSLVRRNR